MLEIVECVMGLGLVMAAFPCVVIVMLVMKLTLMILTA